MFHFTYYREMRHKKAIIEHLILAFMRNFASKKK